MDLKEAAKWVGILVAAGLISTAIELVLEWRVFGPASQATARAEARAEVDRIMTAALKQTQTKAPALSVPAPKYTPSQSDAIML